MPRPKPETEQRRAHFQVAAPEDEWVRAESQRLGISVSAMYRRLMRIARDTYKAKHDDVKKQTKKVEFEPVKPPAPTIDTAEAPRNYIEPPDVYERRETETPLDPWHQHDWQFTRTHIGKKGFPNQRFTCSSCNATELRYEK